MKKIYLDSAATTPCDKQVVEAMRPYFGEIYGNPSSLHSFGLDAAKAVEKARNQVANLIGADPSEIIFTSGGTESDNLAIKGAAYVAKEKGNHIITSKIEHHAVLESCKFLEKDGFKVTYLPVDMYGLVRPSDLEAAITSKTVLVSVMHANNEIGTIEPIKELAEISHKNGIDFHTDAVQTVGHTPISVSDLGVDMLSASAHKFYGPKGVGFLYIKNGVKIVSIMNGGDHENKLRASTLNVPGIVGLGMAAEISQKEIKKEEVRERELSKRLAGGLLKLPQTRLNGHPTKRLAGNVNISFEGVEGESMVLNLNMAGIATSTGSACTSSSLEPSHVLLACGLSPEVAHGSLRFSLGKLTGEEDIDYLLSIFPKIVKKLRQMSPVYDKKEVNYATV